MIKGDMTWSDLTVQLTEKAWADPEFKKRYISNPKAVLEEEFGFKLPKDFKVIIHENTPTEIHVTLPLDVNSMELNDATLALVAGGVTWNDFKGFMGKVVEAGKAAAPHIIEAAPALMQGIAAFINVVKPQK